jgi:hypothetical protein
MRSQLVGYIRQFVEVAAVFRAAGCLLTGRQLAPSHVPPPGPGSWARRAGGRRRRGQQTRPAGQGGDRMARSPRGTGSEWE